VKDEGETMTEIYHITHIRNLPNIINDGGLWCDHVVSDRQLAHVSIAHQNIKERRMIKRVPCSVGGVVADYVPFYFAPRSPMLFALSRGNVKGYTDGQNPILHLVSSAETVQKERLPFAFTDGHAPMDISRFFDDLQYLNQIDWQIMKEIYWADTIEDGDRSRRRQAEFLVHQFFPLPIIETIGVINKTIAGQVAGLLQPLKQKPNVVVTPTWYY
jgi:hypothetical protein